MERLTRRFFVVAAFLAFCPIVCYAVDTQADQQCPPGGQVGQKCKDTTNGFTTQGHCTHIMECKGDSFPTSPPSGGDSGGSPPQTGGQNPPPPTDTTVPNYGGTISSSDYIDQAFQAAQSHATVTSYPTTSKTDSAFTSIDGIDYIASGGEYLRVGAPLTPDLGSGTTIGTATGGAPDKPFDASNLQGFSGLDYQNPGVIPPQGSGGAYGTSGAGGSTFGGDTSNAPVAWGGATFAFASDPTILYAIAGFGMLTLICGGLYIGLHHKKTASEATFEPDKKAKYASTKDESVAKPVATELQEKTIWDTQKTEGRA